MKNDETGYFDLLQKAMDCLIAGDLTNAIERCNDALKSEPDKPEALCVLGFVAIQMEDAGRAIELVQRAHDLDPECRDYADALAVLNARTGKLADSLYFAKLALVLEPHPQLHAMIPAGFRDYRAALENATPSPHYVDAAVRLSLRDYAKAIDSCHKELRVNPRNAACFQVLGQALAATGQFGKAMGAYHASAHIDAPSAALYADMGECLYGLGRPDEGRACLARAAARAPQDRDILTRAVASLAFTADGGGEELADRIAALNGLLTDGTEKVDPADVPSTVGGEKVRIGVISDGFCAGPLAPFLESLFRHLDRRRFAIHGYQQNAFEDATMTRFKSSADEWRRILDVDDDTAANIIARDGINVLVDACSDAESRALAIFARRPAPVQVGWLGWPRGRDLDAVDWWLDEAPVAAGRKARSKSRAKSKAKAGAMRLAGGLVAVDVQAFAMDVGRKTAEGGRQGDIVTFGGRCDLARLTPATAAAWSAALRAVPLSRLLIGHVETIPDEVRTRAQDYFSHFGLVDRVAFQEPHAGRTAAQAFYDAIDVVLDSCPVSDGGLVCEALTVGVPVVGLEAARRTALTGAGILRAAGRADWVAGDEADFAVKAAAVAKDIVEGRLTPDVVRGQVEGSPLCDGAAFARAFEEACMAMLKAGADA